MAHNKTENRAHKRKFAIGKMSTAAFKGTVGTSQTIESKD